MVRTWLNRAWLTLAALGLSLIVAAVVFRIALSNYLPSPGLVWNVLAAPRAIAGPIQGQDLAASAGVPVAVLLFGAALNSAFIVVLAAGLAVIVGIPLGFWLAIHAPRSFSRVLRSVMSLGLAFPAFFIAFLLQIGAVELTKSAGRPLIPVFGFGLDAHLVIPVLALSIAPLAYVARLVALGAEDLEARDFVRTARAKGITELRVVYGHIVPNMVGALSEAALGGVRSVLAALVIVEYLVSWPGLGYLLLRAVRVQDELVLILGIGMLASLFLMLERAIDVVTARTGVVSG